MSRPPAPRPPAAGRGSPPHPRAQRPTPPAVPRPRRTGDGPDATGAQGGPGASGAPGGQRADAGSLSRPGARRPTPAVRPDVRSARERAAGASGTTSSDGVRPRDPATGEPRPEGARSEGVRTVVAGTAAGARLLRRAASRGGDSVRTVARGATDGAPRWVSGLLAGAQSALLSLVVVVVPAVAAYVATSADPTNAGVAWTRAAAVGAALWLLGHGGALVAGGATVSLVPLGITGLSLFAGYASARRSSHRTVAAWLAGIGGHLGVVALVLLLAGGAGPLGAGPGAVLRLVLGSVLVAGLGLGAGVVRPRRARDATRRWWGRVPHVVRAGAVGGVVATASLVGVAALLAGFWVVSHRAAAGDVVAGLGVDTFGGILLAVAQLALAPVLVAWAFAWLAGPGFAVGAGTLYAPSAVVPGPLPALPLLGALPTEAGGPLRWAPLVLVAAGVLAGLWLHRRLVVVRARDVLAAVVVLGVTSGALGALVVALGSGSAGPGRLAVVGAPPVAVGAWVLAGTLVGAALVAVPAEPAVRRAVTHGARAAWARLRGRADVDLTAPEPTSPPAAETPTSTPEP